MPVSSSILSGRFFYALFALAVFGLAVFVISGRGGIGRSWQEFYGPAVFQGCTGVFGLPERALAERNIIGVPVVPKDPQMVPEPEWHQQLREFVLQKRKSFDCSLLPENLKVQPFGMAGTKRQNSMQRGTLLHLLITGTVWQMTSVNWEWLTVISAAYVSITALFGLLIAEFFFTRWLATLIVLAFLVPADSWYLIGRVRDFIKIPPTFAGFLVLMMMTRARTPKQLIWLFALLGLAMGVGVNFRVDLMLVATLFFTLATLGFFTRIDRFGLKTIIAGLTVSVLLFAAFLLPGKLLYPPGESFLSHVLMLGMANPRLVDVNLTPASLSISPIFQDLAVYRQAQLLASWDGIAGELPYRTSVYGMYVWETFKAALEVVPFTALARIPGAIYEAFALPVENLRRLDWIFVPRAILNLVALYGLVLLWRRNANLAFIFTGAIIGMMSISSLLYKIRHVAHYEALATLVTILGVIYFTSALISRFGSENRKAAFKKYTLAIIQPEQNRVAGFIVLAGLGVFSLALAGAAIWQISSVRAELERLENLAARPIKPVIEEYDKIWTSIRLDSEIKRPQLIRLNFNMSRCQRKAFRLQVRRSGVQMKRHASVNWLWIRQSLEKTQNEQLIFTTHRDAYTAFEDILIEKRNLKCLLGIDALDDSNQRPFLWQVIIDGNLSYLGTFRW